MLIFATPAIVRWLRGALLIAMVFVSIGMVTTLLWVLVRLEAAGRPLKGGDF
jgi:hypothetical protein